jgi:hypothetical protein
MAAAHQILVEELFEKRVHIQVQRSAPPCSDAHVAGTVVSVTSYGVLVDLEPQQITEYTEGGECVTEVEAQSRRFYPWTHVYELEVMA